MSNTNNANLAWIMAASTTIMLMAPGVGLFYGGMVNKKNIMSIISFTFLIFSSSTITWGLVGFSLAFGSETLAKGFIGDCTYCGLRNISDKPENPFSVNISFSSFFFLEMMYAGIAGVIITTPFVGRLRTIYLVLISISYQLIIYSPISYWIRSSSGWLNKLGVIDFSGGTMIHLTSGFATFAITYMIGTGKNQLQNQNSTSTFSTLIGTIMIWFSSFGFNGGAALSSGDSASIALINTQLAAAGGVFGWAFTQYIFTDRAKVMGWCCGAICGVISITPCSGYVSLWASIVIGATAAIIVYIYSHLKSQSTNIPDLPGASSCHGISSFWGILCAGAFATLQSKTNYQGLFYGGTQGARLFGVNLLCAIVSSLYSFIVMLFIHFLTLRLVEPYLPEQQQEEGLDSYSHVQDNDPLDEEDIVNIIKTLNKYNQINKMLQSNFEEQKKPFFEKQKLKKQIKSRKSLPQMQISRENLMKKINQIDRKKEGEMIQHYQKTVRLRNKQSTK